jgi:hypothetical protein
MLSLYYWRDWKLIDARRKAYAVKLRAKGIIEGSNKWNKLMYRKVG